jgi:hypothetical protein
MWTLLESNQRPRPYQGKSACRASSAGRPGLQDAGARARLTRDGRFFSILERKRAVALIDNHAMTKNWLRTGLVPGTQIKRTQGDGTFVLSHTVPGTSIQNNEGTFEGKPYFSQTTEMAPGYTRTIGGDTFYTTVQIPGTNLYRTQGTINGREVFNISSKPELNGDV